MWCTKVLVAYDGSTASNKALKLAQSIISEDESIKLVLVHVLKIYSSVMDAGLNKSFLEGTAAIREKLEGVAESLPNEAHVHILRGTSPADLILNAADDEECDLIIMGSRGKGGVKGYLGSVSYAVVQKSAVTVVIAKDTSV